MKTVLLLLVSNTFMTLAWYGHLKFAKGHDSSMLKLILISWGIAFFEYCFQVPANRLGWALYRITTQDHSRGDFYLGFCGFCLAHPGRKAALELRRCICSGAGGRISGDCRQIDASNRRVK